MVGTAARGFAVATVALNRLSESSQADRMLAIGQTLLWGPMCFPF